ncbi:hypothetical protein [Cohaesibacter gelatinilyticus]|uniref:Uncharacterized protein n=1 Tax=Cohaesibacter gelatinilyticus TaxID=372072 RepID=A0A285N936_9HYPH|nr:hypothetical protein [Cohaesibacter gelatinilyticus]SNZ06014.1 hypothetical protein SAMN06265368_0266 [Cohaesibacter gelatinilyticus]
MDRKNQPLWLRLLNAVSVLAILVFVFIYQARLSDWPAYLLVLVTIGGAIVNFVLHLKDAMNNRVTDRNGAGSSSEGSKK